MTDSSQKEFEEWATASHFYIPNDLPYLAWQASRNSALKEVIDLVKLLKDNSTDYILYRLMDIIHETNED